MHYIIANLYTAGLLCVASEFALFVCVNSVT